MKIIENILNIKQDNEDEVLRCLLKRRRRSSKFLPRAKERKSWFSNRSVTSIQSSVSFALNLDGSVKEEVCPVPNARTLSNEEIDECWWSKEEFSEVRDEAHLIIERFVHNPDYQDAAEQLLAHCYGRFNASIMTPFARKRFLGILVAGKARGFEYDSLALLKVRQMHVVRSLLDTQDRLRDQHTWTQRSHLLALQYRRISAYSAAWARLIAAGDELYSK